MSENQPRRAIDLGPMPPVVARCDACGGGFVFMMPDIDAGPCPYTGCNGTVRRLAVPEVRSGRLKRETST